MIKLYSELFNAASEKENQIHYYTKFEKRGKKFMIKKYSAMKKGVENEGKPSNFEAQLFIHETKKENVSSILKNGFIPSKLYVGGVYTIPESDIEPELMGRGDIRLAIRLRPNSKIFWTDSERPTDAHLGFGNQFYENLYETLISKTTLKTRENVIKGFQTESISRNELLSEFSTLLREWLVTNGYCGIQQGGEVVISDLSAIANVEIYK